MGTFTYTGILAKQHAIPETHEAFNEWRLKLWQELFRQHGLNFAWPLSIELMSSLLACLFQAHEPELAPHMIPVVIHMPPSVLSSTLKAMISKHVRAFQESTELKLPTTEQGRRGRKKADDWQQKEILLYGLVQLEREKQYHWDPATTIQKILNDYPDLRPTTEAKREAWQTLHSKLRTVEKKARVLQQEKERTLKDDLDALFLGASDADIEYWLRLGELEELIQIAESDGQDPTKYLDEQMQLVKKPFAQKLAFLQHDVATIWTAYAKHWKKQNAPN